METDYSICQQIGGNSTTAVYSAVRRPDSRSVVLKMFNKSTMNCDMLYQRHSGNDSQGEYIPAEIHFLERLQHLEGCVRMLNFFDDTINGRWVVVLENLEAEGYSNLAREISRTDTPMDEETVSWILRELIRVVMEVHSCGVLHCDLKPDNIFINRELKRVKLIDFNLATDLKLSATKTNPPGCTPDYAPPEVLVKRKQWTAAGEVWSIGCTAFVLLCRRFPFENPWMSVYSSPDYPQHTHSHQYAISEEFGQRKRNFYRSPTGNYVFRSTKAAASKHKQNSLSTKAKDFLLVCLCRCPEQRPTLQLLLKHPFLAEKFKIPQVTVTTLPNPCRTILVS